MIATRFFFSLLCALAMMILPFPYMWQWFMPDWCLLVFFAWYLVDADRVPIWLPWILGLVLDGLTGSVIGLHALAYVITWYILSLFSVRIALFPMVQKMLVMLLVASVNLFIMLCAQALFSGAEISWYRLYSVFFTSLCWPGILLLVNKMAAYAPQKAWGRW